MKRHFRKAGTEKGTICGRTAKEVTSDPKLVGCRTCLKILEAGDFSGYYIYESPEMKKLTGTKKVVGMIPKMSSKTKKVEEKKETLHFKMKGLNVLCGNFKAGRIATIDRKRVNCPDCLKKLKMEKVEEKPKKVEEIHCYASNTDNKALCGNRGRKTVSLSTVTCPKCLLGLRASGRLPHKGEEEKFSEDEQIGGECQYCCDTGETHGKSCMACEESSQVKPPLGLVSRNIRSNQRMHEIFDAMRRYSDVVKPIPSEWIKELSELCWEKETLRRGK